MAGRPNRTRRLGVVGALATLACAACTAPGGATAAPTPLPGDVTLTAPTPAPTSEVTPTSAAPSTAPSWTPWQAPTASTPVQASPSYLPLPTPTMGMPVPSTNTAGPVLRVYPGTQQAITIADAFSAGSWVQGGYRPVGSAQTIEALASPVGCNGTSGALELRFAQTTGTLVLGVAQALDSASASEKLTWTVTTDGKLARSVAIGFRETADIAVPVAGVSVVDVTASLPGPCAAGATGLIVRAVVNG